eukprot:5223708-Amphidinium_carterae.1
MHVWDASSNSKDSIQLMHGWLMLSGNLTDSLRGTVDHVSASSNTTRKLKTIQGALRLKPQCIRAG